MPEPGPLDPLTAALLGAIQGATEFLPVSSSGHVAVSARWFGAHDLGIAFTLLLHVGTLVATLLVVGKPAWSLVRRGLSGLMAPRAFMDDEEGREAIAVIAGTLPTAVVGLALAEAAEAAQRDLQLVGGFFLVTAALLLASRRLGQGSLDVLPPMHAALVGVAQGVAAFPGISRSGTTIAVAMALGLKPDAAFRFSFLLSLPAILGATLLKGREGLDQADPMAISIGALVAFIVGYVSLRLLRGVVSQGRLWSFALYLAPLGVVCLLA